MKPGEIGDGIDLQAAREQVMDGGDVTIRCVECGLPFVWRRASFALFTRRGWPPPKRCDRCIAAKHRRHGEPARRYRAADKEQR